MIGEKMFIAPTESDAYIFPKSDIAFAVTPVPIPTFDTIVVKVTLVIYLRWFHRVLRKEQSQILLMWTGSRILYLI